MTDQLPEPCPRCRTLKQRIDALEAEFDRLRLIRVPRNLNQEENLPGKERADFQEPETPRQASFPGGRSPGFFWHCTQPCIWHYLLKRMACSLSASM